MVDLMRDDACSTLRSAYPGEGHDFNLSTLCCLPKKPTGVDADRGEYFEGPGRVFEHIMEQVDYRTAEDSLEHYFHCPSIKFVALAYLRIPGFGKESFQLATSFANDEDLVCTAVLIYAAYCATDAFRAQGRVTPALARDAVEQHCRNGSNKFVVGLFGALLMSTMVLTGIVFLIGYLQKENEARKTAMVEAGIGG
ncbi:unnamed protein product [Prorocentrum cordatum]|uniref:Uncharacterized protein n=1 Tax=Prorocentrum cordatum TaxID=2364126 RepID=A0ABN9SVL7_9DINO|nr:unnamed protein product [Polarella glacialis]